MSSIYRIHIFLALAALLAPLSAGLECYYEVVRNGKPDSGKDTKHNCPDDKYCISVGGSISGQNLSVEARGCESDIKSVTPFGTYVLPACEKQQSEKNSKIGPLEYWYNCCDSNLCNNAALSTVMPPLLTVTALFVARQLKFA